VAVTSVTPRTDFPHPLTNRIATATYRREHQPARFESSYATPKTIQMKINRVAARIAVVGIASFLMSSNHKLTCVQVAPGASLKQSDDYLVCGRRPSYRSIPAIRAE